MTDSGIYLMARFARGACVGAISAVTLGRHGWAWMVVVVVMWSSQLIIEHHLLSERSA